MSCFQKILILLFLFLFLCVVYSAAIQIPWSTKEGIQAAVIGNSILGMCTAGGATLVILAAIIQAAAMDRQLKSSEKKDNNTLLRRYIGWLEVMINTQSGLYAANRARAYNLRSWVLHDPTLSNVPDIQKWIVGFSPERPLADPRVYDLRALVPLNLTSIIAEGSEALADIEQTLVNIRIRFDSRAAGIPHPKGIHWDADIKMQVEKLDRDFGKLIRSYEAGIPQAKIHLQSKMAEAASLLII